MNWQNCICDFRTGSSNTSKQDPRSTYQRDYDRLIFSSAFRRLQGKTQVFPLPGNTFVHNRLTHSLETSAVGRSLGDNVGQFIAEHFELDNEVKQFYQYHLKTVIASACLAHDLGNPAFGHSGEAAISNYFKEFADVEIEGQRLQDHVSPAEWADLTNFEGNANAIRILTRQYNGKSKGGLRLTYTTLASLIKYPCASNEVNKAYKHRKKYGFFRSDQSMYEEIASATHMIKDANAEQAYYRHPFVYLTEAADDICYLVIDLEDAHRIGIVSRAEVESSLIDIIAQVTTEENAKGILNYSREIIDDNEGVSLLRAMAIGALVKAATEVFKNNHELIIQGQYASTLMDDIAESAPAIDALKDLSRKRIYNHSPVVEIEIAGYNVMSELLQMYVPAVLSDKPNTLHKKVLRLLPEQFSVEGAASSYEKIMLVIDHISAMTDGYATELYRKIKGIEISKH